jgi:hypothetical protein
MKNTIIKYTWIIFLILLLIFGIYKLSTRKERTFKIVQIDKHNFIQNKTDKPYLDSIVHVGMNELGINGTYIIIRSLTKETKKQFSTDIELKAYIKGLGKQYVIWVDDMGRDETIRVLSHELIHLRQYYNGKLVVSDGLIKWNDQIIPVNELSTIDYNSRPWEIEAFQEQKYLDIDIRKVLY